MTQQLYQHVVQAIAFIEEYAQEQLTLSDVAAIT